MIVVTGATGQVGAPLVRALAGAGEKVRAVARGVTTGDVPPGVEAVAADLSDPGSLTGALDGADALFLLTSGAFMASGAGLDGTLDVARAGGVGRVVLLSSQGVGTGHHPSGLEDAVRASGLPWTILRAGGFHANALAWAGSVRARRTVAAPFSDVAVPTVDPSDVAAVAATVLSGPGRAGAVLELTGPEPVTPRQQAATIGEALGEPVRFVEQSRAEAAAAMAAFLPEPVLSSTLDLLGSPPDALRRAGPDVERVLGRPGRTFAAWARDHVDAFR